MALPRPDSSNTVQGRLQHRMGCTSLDLAVNGCAEVDKQGRITVPSDCYTPGAFQRHADREVKRLAFWRVIERECGDGFSILMTNSRKVFSHGFKDVCRRSAADYKQVSKKQLYACSEITLATILYIYMPSPATSCWMLLIGNRFLFQ